MGIADPIREAFGLRSETDATRDAAGDGAPRGAGPDPLGHDPLDHFHAGDDAPVAPGVYRVVGRSDDAVTLLRVAEDGRRVHSGVVVRVPLSDLEAFAAGDNPDTGLGRLRQAPGTLAERPLYAGLALLFVAFGLYEIAIGGDWDGVIAVGGGLVLLWFLLR